MRICLPLSRRVTCREAEHASFVRACGDGDVHGAVGQFVAVFAAVVACADGGGERVAGRSSGMSSPALALR